MTSSRSRRNVLSHLLALCTLAGGCGPTPNDGADMGTPAPGPDLSGQEGPDLSGAQMSQVTFRYTPLYAGVTGVAVIGGFGLPSDWSMTGALLTLQNDGSGTFTGTAMLPAGQYPYLFRVTETGANGGAATRLAIDPLTASHVVCPMASPAYTENPKNPCSQISVPQGAPDPVLHLTGTVTVNGAKATDYVVMLEREETGEHHFFANQMQVKADGAYDLPLATGGYRLQVFPPSFFAMTDATRNPLTLQTHRRALSVGMPVTKDIALGAIEMAFQGYGMMMPRSGTQALPVTLSYPVPQGVMGVLASVYGTKNGTGKNIGDPWWNGAQGVKTSASFDGTFTTMQALESKVITGEQYWWGIWITLPKSPAGVQWRFESMVFPIKF